MAPGHGSNCMAAAGGGRSSPSWSPACLVKADRRAAGGFCLDASEENEGLDRAAHGEVGFDFGPAIDIGARPVTAGAAAATVPPNGQKRFTVVVEGVEATS